MKFSENQNPKQAHQNTEQNRLQAFNELKTAIQGLEQEFASNIELYKGHLCYLFRSIIYRSLTVKEISKALVLDETQINGLENYIVNNNFLVLDKIDNPDFEWGMEFLATSEVELLKERKTRTKVSKNYFSFGSYDYEMFKNIHRRDLRSILNIGNIQIVIRYNENPAAEISIGHDMVQFSRVPALGNIYRFRFVKNTEVEIAQEYQEFFNFYILFSLIRYKVLLGQIPDLDKNPRTTQRILEKFEFFEEYLKIMRFYLETLAQKKYGSETQKQEMLKKLISRIDQVIDMSENFYRSLRS